MASMSSSESPPQPYLFYFYQVSFLHFTEKKLKFTGVNFLYAISFPRKCKQCVSRHNHNAFKTSEKRKQKPIGLQGQNATISTSKAELEVAVNWRE